jgi:hypothetical protein
MSLEQLQAEDVEDLDFAAFGVRPGVQEVRLDRLSICWTGDLEMARYELNRTPKKWDPHLDVPVKVVVRELRRGMWIEPLVIGPPGIMWCLDDGHHRYERSLVLGRTSIKADVTVEASPVRALLRRFKEPSDDTALLEALGLPNRPSASPRRPVVAKRGRAALVQSIAKGRLLYHGTSAAEDFAGLRGPAWVSERRDVAEYFARWWEGDTLAHEVGDGTGTPRILTFRVTQTITKLARPRNPRELQALMDELWEESDSPEEMAEATCNRYNGWIVPDNYHPGGDIMLCRPQRWLEFVSAEVLEPRGRPSGRFNRPSASPEPTDLVRRRLLNQGFPAKLVTELLNATGPTRARDAAWMGRRIQQQIRATPGGGQRDVVKALLGTVRLIAAWILATRPNYTKMPLDEALGAAEAWSRVPIPARSHDVVHDFGDGWAWVRVPVDEYAAEGAALRCSLSRKYRRFAVFSLRDPKNRSHAALTAFPGKRGWELKEVKGKANARPPAPAYSTRIVSWLLTKPLGDLRLFRLGKERARDDLAAVLGASEIPARLSDVLSLEES